MVSRALGVLEAVDFDNQSFFATEEIDNEWAERDLSREFVAVQATCA
ncbi:UNVERIFIED_ORG: hypothetical protein GGD59_003064 [Rhizobium esperanzae]